MLSPREYDVLLGQFMMLNEQIEQALRILQLLRPEAPAKPLEEHGPPRARVTKTFGRAHSVPIDPDEAAVRATEPASAYISPESQGDSDRATSAKGEESAVNRS